MENKQFWECVVELNRPIVFDKQLCKQKKLPQPTQIVYADATPWQIGISILHKDRLFDQSIPLPWLHQSQAELLAAAYAAQVAKYQAELYCLHRNATKAPQRSSTSAVIFPYRKKEPHYKIRSKRMERGRFSLPNKTTRYEACFQTASFCGVTPPWSSNWTVHK